MTEAIRDDEQDGAELERRLQMFEGPAAEEIVQPNLPVGDVLWLLAAIVSVSLLLLWWAL